MLRYINYITETLLLASLNWGKSGKNKKLMAENNSAKMDNILYVNMYFYT